MLASALLLASAISAPSMSNDVLYRLLNTYPSWALREGKSAATVIDVVVEPDGKVRECTVLSFVGDERLANEECSRVERVRLLPAKGPDGEPILGKFRTIVVRLVDDSRQQEEIEGLTRAPDMVLEVARLPDGAEAKEIALDLLIDPTGAVKLCDAGAKSEGPENAPYVEAACQQARTMTAGSPTGQAAISTAYVMSWTVRFQATGPD